MSSPAPSLPSTPGASSPANAPAPKSKSTKAARVRAVTNFSKLLDSVLVTLATAVIKGLTGNAELPNPTVDLTAFGKTVTTFSAAIAAALDGGKNAKAVRDKQRKLVIQDLKSLALYVENNCNDDPAILTTSGFSLKTPVKTAGQPVVAPTIKTLDYGANSGQITVTLKKVSGAKVYFLRYAAMTAGSPGTWTDVPVPSVNKKTMILGLTPGVTYEFQTRSLGSVGYSDWSDSTTIMCI
jgi:hypothetical protein